MTHRISRATLGTLVLYAIFAAVAIYTLQGRFTEQSSILVEHFVAGAGNLWLFVMCPLAVVLSVLPFTLWPVPTDPKGHRLQLVAAALPPIIMVATLIGLERHASQYDYETFVDIINTYENGSTVTKEQAIELLGAPLSQEQIDGREMWSYTYMPSTGFGWHKRVISFDQTGQMIGYINFDEP